MATIVHRRVVRRSVPVAVAATPVDPILEPRAPDAGLEAAMSVLSEKLTWVGWLSLAGALGFLIIELRYLLDPGALSEANLTSNVFTIGRALSGTAAIALPAALELGGTGARRVVPWLMRGAMLIALSEVARLVVSDLRTRAFSGDSQLIQFDYSQPAVLALAIAAYAPAILLIAGLWALSDGLADSGARPHRRILAIVATAAVALSAASYVVYANAFDPRTMAGLLNLVSLLVSFVAVALSAVLAVRLLAGARDLVPRRAWLIGGVAGACQLVATLGAALFVFSALGIGLLTYAVFAADNAVWVLLAVAFAMGLGRREGEAPEPTRRLVARWVRYPAS